jgi:hypothetical protein
MGDIRKGLEDEMAAMQTEASTLERQRDEIDKKLQDVTNQLNALRVIYDGQTRRFGARESSINRFAGMGVVEALSIIKSEQPHISREKAHDILVREGFNFRGKKSKRVVNFGWMALERSEKKRSER